MAKPAKVTRILHSRDLNRSKYDRLVAIAVLCGRVRGDAWQRVVHGTADTPRDPRRLDGRDEKRHNAQVRDFLCQAAHSVVDRAGTIACEDLTASMKSVKVIHRDTQRRLNGWVKGVMADTLTSISRRRGTALALMNPAYTSQIDSRTGLLQGERRRDRFYGLDGVVLDADTNAARDILARMYDDEITLYTPFREVKRLLQDRSGTTVGTAPPGLESAQAANAA